MFYSKDIKIIKRKYTNWEKWFFDTKTPQKINHQNMFFFKNVNQKSSLTNQLTRKRTIQKKGQRFEQELTD